MTEEIATLVLIRHGNTAWNLSDRFSGWSDIPMVEQGREQAIRAGKTLAAAGITIDEVHASVLQRTRQTAETMLTAAQHDEIPLHTSWRLNERHYGQLQGMNKQEILAAWGEQNYRLWWRGYHHPPPAWPNT